MANSKLNIDDDELDDVPLTKRRIRPTHNPYTPSIDSPIDITAKSVCINYVKEWPGLPRGVKFSPSDEDLLWHLLVKVGMGNNDPHPFIGQFITCLDDMDAFGHVHPENLPGIKRDGSESFFFHRTVEAYNSRNKKCHVKKKNDNENFYWHESSASKQFLIEGEHQGIKKNMNFWMSRKEGKELVATNWVMHQYQLGTADYAGEFAVSRMFYDLKSDMMDKHVENMALKTFEAISSDRDAVTPAKPVKYEADEECQQDNLVTNEPIDQEKSLASSLLHKSSAHNGSMTTDRLHNTSSMEGTCGSDDIPWNMCNANASLPVSQMLRYECEPLSSRLTDHLIYMKEVAMEDVHANKIFETKGDADININEPCSLDGGFNDDNLTNSDSFGNISYSNNSPTPVTNSQEHHMAHDYLSQAPVSRDMELSPSLPELNDRIRLQNSVLSSDIKVKTEPVEQYITDRVLAVASSEITSSTGCCCSSSGSLLNSSTHGLSSHKSASEKILFSSTYKSPDSVLPPDKVLPSDLGLPPVDPTVVKSENLGTFVENMQSTFSKADVPVVKEGCQPNFDCNKERNFPKQDKPKSDSEKVHGSHFSNRRKRKKTATNSVETALEEDAPGLLQVLLDKGIIPEEMKLYGSKDDDDDDALDISSEDENFDDLESVMSKLFSEKSSLPKLSVARLMKGSKANYCLSCLIALVEQTRYLQFRNSPVEWGWCRDLQSFIFVFQQHNRIVVERPEYGYATYFFELVYSLPVDWQIKRLVIAMKLPSCGRSTLLENKPLLIGEDLTEGEARILEEYGWTPNCGLGTMLNYHDRVVHDKKNERYTSEWRAKIGKLLMDGHDGGRTVGRVPKKAAGCIATQGPEIKMEYEEDIY